MGLPRPRLYANTPAYTHNNTAGIRSGDGVAIRHATLHMSSPTWIYGPADANLQLSEGGDHSGLFLLVEPGPLHLLSQLID